MAKNSEIQITLSIPKDTNLNTLGFQSSHSAWKEIINKSSKEILLSQMYLSAKCGDIADELISDLIESSARDVCTKLIIDKYIYRKNSENNNVSYTKPVTRIKREPHIEIFYDNINAITGGLQHSKCLVSDAQTAWIGSNNFDWRSFEHIIELGVKITHPALCANLHYAMRYDLFTIPPIEAPSRAEPLFYGPHEITYNDTQHFASLVGSPIDHRPSLIPDAFGYLTDIIGSAKQEVLIQARKMSLRSRAPGAPNWHEFVNAILSAASKGVKIRLLFDQYQLADPNDRKLISDLDGTNNIYVRIIRIPQSIDGYIPYARMLHSKSVTVDCINSWIGSSNFGPDDFLRSRNYGLAISGVPFSKDVVQIFESLWHSQYAFSV
jgi:HKD family nuclease